jgi:hypothetical protein
MKRAFHWAFQVSEKAFHFQGPDEAFHLARAYRECETVKRGENVSSPVSTSPRYSPMDAAFHFTVRPLADRETQTPCGVR